VSAVEPGAWPVLPAVDDWRDTRDTVHLWTQVVGKVRMALEPLVNHWWYVTLYVSARGLTTSLMPTADGRAVDIEFDFLDGRLVIRTTDGETRHVALEPRSVASFFHETMDALGSVGVRPDLHAAPNEVPDAIPFADDEEHRSYDGDSVQRFWHALVHVDRVLTRFRAGFLGKASPVHLFWGGFDLCTTRFSGRTAPRHPGGVPNCPDRVQHLAYSHEVSSVGFWPDGGNEGAFYAYAYPEPDGFADWPVAPAGAARYERAAGEFLLPYELVRATPDPDATLLDFCRTTYEAAAELAHWDRDALEARDDDA
jgi:hypothetical protein